MLLHVCCAPCSSHVLSVLYEEYDITAFFYNPNITEKAEYEKRIEELERFTQEAEFARNVIVCDGVYEPEKFYEIARGLENVETRITDDLYNDILESLRGFTDYMQLEIADDVLDYVCNKSVHKTNIKTVDTLLKGMYARIKEQHDHPEKFGLHIV